MTTELSQIETAIQAAIVRNFPNDTDEIYGIGKSYYRHRHIATLNTDVPSLLPQPTLHAPSLSDRTLLAISRSEFESFACNGFVVLQDVCRKSIPALSDEVSRLHESGVTKEIHDGRTASLSTCRKVTRHSSVFSSLLHSSQVAAIVTDLIGDPSFVHFDELYIRRPRIGKGTPWHQDTAYYFVPDPLKSLTMWIPLTDASEGDAHLCVVSRSHGSARLHRPEATDGHRLECRVNPAESLLLNVPAGGAACMAYGLVHRTLDNTSEKCRPAVAFHFMSYENAQHDMISCRPQYSISM